MCDIGQIRGDYEFSKPSYALIFPNSSTIFTYTQAVPSFDSKSVEIGGLLHSSLFSLDRAALILKSPIRQK